ncbi:ABC transporter ATP-binding protein [Methylobacterium sp. J-076]|uniref:ABC transporter ATP-binding protein n=1 Tax=Methylobacterium sp. J-076 TaxID=2836655 RepID=UPI001FBA4D29|nr:sn-glycerol-3-phosphate ABC transporter ATP-binding protein UgpC [Methylobacterium sp. J-076]MCJ2014297.1 sn-glycerol-3-phosphate ABC transporter ATP-binding protein UgpC [Methylobacterium sp. J-076]
MAGLRLEGLRKSFGAHEILKGVDLALADGEMLVIVGASGCGKSTLLRLVAGLETPSAGRILIDGRDVTGIDPSARDIAMVFQNYALYPHMSVFDNMAYGLKIRGLPRAEIRAKVDAASALLGLEALLDRKPRQLSGGQRQRVAMGRAIVRDPKLFLFDEPLSNLDAKLRVQMRGEIRRLQRRLKVTSLYVTHDQVEAMTLGDRLLVMHQGVPVQLATPTEVFERPADTYVAGFIGSPAMNLLPGLLGRNGTAVSLDGTEIDLGPRRIPRPDGHRVILGIRPEHVALDPAGAAWPVEVVELLGSEMLVHGRSAAGASLTLRTANGPPPGEAIRVSFPAAHLHVFDEATGLRLEPAG